MRCHICAKLCGHPAILIHEPQCYKKWRTNAMARPPSRRLPPPQRPSLDAELEAYNEAAQKASDMCMLTPCPQCGRRFPEDKIKAHVRACEDEPPPDAEPPPPPVDWGAVTEVGLEWTIEELERFCRRRRAESARRERDPDHASWVLASGCGRTSVCNSSEGGPNEG
eukprot:SAG31_NODE_4845_length_2908_cov_5.326095_4_plen_167_part_00